jgi:hypothetical protein
VHGLAGHVGVEEDEDGAAGETSAPSSSYEVSLVQPES